MLIVIWLILRIFPNHWTFFHNFDDYSVEDQLTKVVQAYERIVTSFTVQGAFRKTGFTPDSIKKPCRPVFNGNGLLVNRDFQRFGISISPSMSSVNKDNPINLASSMAIS
jgi:hypothetical protein